MRQVGGDTVFIGITTRSPLGIVGVVVTAVMGLAGYLQLSGWFRVFWCLFSGLFGLYFLWLSIRAYPIELFIRDGVLHWKDTGKSGSVPVSAIVKLRVEHEAGRGYPQGPRFDDVTLYMKDGSTVELPPDLAAQVACQYDEFYHCLKERSPDIEKEWIEV